MATPFMRCAYQAYALHTVIPRGVRMTFFKRTLRSTYFFAAAKKSKQKKPLEGNALHPLIYSFLQGETGFFRSTASPS